MDIDDLHKILITCCPGLYCMVVLSTIENIRNVPEVSQLCDNGSKNVGLMT